MKPQFETIEKAGFHKLARYEHEQPEILAGFGTDIKLARAMGATPHRRIPSLPPGRPRSRPGMNPL